MDGRRRHLDDHVRRRDVVETPDARERQAIDPDKEPDPD
jgi:hypothetical protein